MSVDPCAAPKSGEDLPLEQAGLDRGERAVLTVMRYFFQSFTHPESQGWMDAFQAAFEHFPQEKAANLAVAALSAIQAMRSARCEGFQFSNPDCPSCRKVMSRDERQLLGTLAATRRGHQSRAHSHALILCEGSDTQPFLTATRELSLLMAEIMTSRERNTVPSS